MRTLFYSSGFQGFSVSLKRSYWQVWQSIGHHFELRKKAAIS
jgi:hypothetical protein